MARHHQLVSQKTRGTENEDRCPPSPDEGGETDSTKYRMDRHFCYSVLRNDRKPSFISKLGTALNERWYLDFSLWPWLLIVNFFLDCSIVTIDQTMVTA
jgi:hypothetical protein